MKQPPTAPEAADVVNQIRMERWCIWSGLVGIVLFFLGFICADFIPPLSAGLSVEEVVRHYQEHANGIRTGGVVMMISGMFVAPMIGVISAYMRRIPGASPALAYGQISAGTAGMMFFFIGALFFIVTAYRPERNPELTFMLNDLSWIMAVLPWPPAFMANLCIAAAIWSDKRDQPTFPRWLAYLNIWVSLGFIPGSLIPFFKTGPFAWQGILAFWLAGTVFGLWFIAMTVMMLKANSRQLATVRQPQAVSE